MNLARAGAGGERMYTTNDDRDLLDLYIEELRGEPVLGLAGGAPERVVLAPDAPRDLGRHA